jgi:hypothetical protein
MSSQRKRANLILDSILVALAVWLAGETLVRRWLWGQVPTQIGAIWVYALVALVAAVAAWHLRRVWRTIRRPA